MLDPSKYIKMPKNKTDGIKSLLGVPAKTMDGMYEHAYNLYNTGRYKEAIPVFRNLTTLHTNESKYMLGLASCYHMLKDYQMAAGVYLVVSTVDPNNPIPYFHSSDCYMQMGDKVSAIVMLEMAISNAKETKYEILKQRAEISLAGLKKEVFKKDS